MPHLNRRSFVGAASAALTSPLVSRAQPLTPVRLVVLRNPPAIGTTECVATCIRGSVYDVSHDASFSDPESWIIPFGVDPLCDVIERPWHGNKPNVSSIPAGTYSAFVRDDPTKSWMTNLNRRWRIQLQGVSGGRSAIQFHYGRDEKWSQGCFIVGDHVVDAPTVGDLESVYCRLKNGEAAIARLRAAVTAPSVNPDAIQIVVAGRNGMFPRFTTGC